MMVRADLVGERPPRGKTGGQGMEGSALRLLQVSDIIFLHHQPTSTPAAFPIFHSPGDNYVLPVTSVDIVLFPWCLLVIFSFPI